MKQLEQSLDHCLFARHPRGIEATPAAHAFHEHVCRAFDSIDDGVDAIGRQGKNQVGETVGSVTELFSNFISIIELE